MLNLDSHRKACVALLSEQAGTFDDRCRAHMDKLSDLAPSPSVVLGSLYDCVTADQGFQHFIEVMAEVFSFKAVTLITRQLQQQGVKAIWLHGITPAAIESYAMDYGQENMLAQHINSAPIACFYASNLHLPEPDESIQNSRFYQEWMIPQGVAHTAGAVILREGEWLTEIIVQRSVDHPAFTHADIAALNGLMPHLQRAIQMRQRFSDLQTGQNFLRGGLDALTIPTFLVDESGRAAWRNRQAEGLLLSNDTLSCVNGQFMAKDQNAAQRISDAISDAITLGQSTAQSSGKAIQIARFGLLPLTLIVTPLSFDTSGKRGRGAIVFAFDPEQSLTISTEQVRDLFNLTNAEAQLAVCLCEGRPLEACAGDRGVSINTTKSQLRRIFAKTGTSRQVDLLALLFTSPAYFIASHEESGLLG
jgi:DNA-binding CsgD family transcriptional regulator